MNGFTLFMTKAVRGRSVRVSELGARDGLVVAARLQRRTTAWKSGASAAHYLPAELEKLYFSGVSLMGKWTARPTATLPGDSIPT